MVAGFGVGLAYYGMPLGLSSLPFNLYMSVALNALCDSLSSLILLFVIGKPRRKVSMIGLCLFSGICNVMSIFLRVKGLRMGFELFSFFSNCMAFNDLLVYTMELFPTSIRNSDLSIMQEAILLGGLLGPVMAAVGRKNGFMSYGVFGVTILFCGLFVVWLPETKGTVLCDTVEDEEGKYGVNSNCVDYA
ncbi:organic cation/carnitine transporter 3 [Phtheirospermum japonicum]|uniref:Organic cation/carnitine transporter 3 n=1 Tax=Phtheirospermum japonicum TaxID=374723 RepID=A0A830B9H3_9LAMI|nr:organic cation/carnitine transporter 3 [Phtheirospermum japonicum]